MQRTEQPTAHNTLMELFGYDPEEDGIGGLSESARQTIVSLFMLRSLPADLLDQLGIEQPRGVLFEGPPGTGKTLIAKKMAHRLSRRPPIEVASAEVLHHFVGGSVDRITKLFEPAHEDERNNGANADLWTYIFDEIEVILRQRGSVDKDGAGGQVNDQMVTALLNELDGVKGAKNVLVFALTNDSSNMDEAVLRSGRFGIHIHIGLPGEQARQSILRIHTNRLSENKYISLSTEDVAELASLMQNYTGADIKEVIQRAARSVLFRNIPQIAAMIERFPTELEIRRQGEREAIASADDVASDKLLVNTLRKAMATPGVDGKLGVIGSNIDSIAQQLFLADKEEKVRRGLAKLAKAPPILYASGTRQKPQMVGIPYLPDISMLQGGHTSSAKAMQTESIRKRLQSMCGGDVEAFSRALDRYHKDPVTFVGMRRVRAEVMNQMLTKVHEGRYFPRILQITKDDLKMAARLVRPQSGSSRDLLIPYQRSRMLCQRHAVEAQRIKEMLQAFCRDGTQRFLSIAVSSAPTSGRTTLIRHVLASCCCSGGGSGGGSVDLFPMITVVDVGFLLSCSAESGMALVSKRFTRALTEAEHATSNALVLIDGVERIPREHPVFSQIAECLRGSRYTGHVDLEHKIVLMTIGTEEDQMPAQLTVPLDLTLKVDYERNDAIDVIFPGVAGAQRLKTATRPSDAICTATTLLAEWRVHGMRV